MLFIVANIILTPFSDVKTKATFLAKTIFSLETETTAAPWDSPLTGASGGLSPDPLRDEFSLDLPRGDVLQ